MNALTGNVNALFSAAVERVAAQHPDMRTLLLALALARGRGLPRVDGTWVAVADALGRRPVDEDLVDLLLRTAAPYVMLDAEHGQGVYRLAHRAFIEHFRDEAATADRHRRIVRTLATAAAGDLPRPPCSYVVHHLSGHAAAAQTWDELAHFPQLIDYLDPDTLAADLLRTSFGRADLPAEMAAVLNARPALIGAAPRDRAAIRALAMARTEPQPDFVATNPDAPAWFVPRERETSRERTATTGDGVTIHESWLVDDHPIIVVHRSRGRRATRVRVPGARPSVRGGAVRWARLQPNPLHVTLSGHGGPVRALAAVPLADGRVLLASSGDDRTVRLWNPATGQPVGDPMRGHDGSVLALTPITLADGQVLLASAGDDQTIRLWNPATRLSVGETFADQAGAVRFLAALRLRDGQVLLAIGGRNGSVRLWDPVTGRLRGRLDRPDTPGWLDRPNTPGRFGGTGPVRSMAAVPSPDGGTVLATCYESLWGGGSRVHLWDPDRPGTGRDGPMTTLPNKDILGEVVAVASMTAHGRAFLAAVEEGLGQKPTLRLYDLAKGQESNTAIAGPDYDVGRWAVLPFRDGTLLAATVDRVVKLWTVRKSWRRVRLESFGGALTGHLGTIRDIVTVPISDGRGLIATAADDGTIRLWSPARASREAELPRKAWFRTSTGVDPALTVTSVAAGTSPGGRTWLATGSRDERVRLWDTELGTLVQPPMNPQTGRTTWFTGSVTVAPVPMPDGSALLATGSGHILRLVDPQTGASGAAAELARIEWQRWSSNEPVNARMLREEHVAGFAPIVAMVGVLPPGGSTVLVVAGGRTVQFWAPTARLELRRLDRQVTTHGHIRAVAAVPHSTDDMRLAIATDRTLQIWGAGAEPAIAVHTESIRALAAVPTADGSTMLASGDEKGAIRFWSPDTGHPLGEPIYAHRAAVRALAVGGGLLLSGGDDQTLRMWDADTGVAVHEMPLGVTVSGLAVSGSTLFVTTGEGLLAMDLDETISA
jgi:WD40 repeat protein